MAKAAWLTGFAVLALAGCGDNRMRASSSELRVTPEQLDFGPTGLGSTKSLEVRLVNEGRSPVHVSDLRFTIPALRAAQFAPFELGASEERSLKIEFSPSVEGEVTGALELAADARNLGEEGLSIHPVAGLAVRAFVEAVPQALDFGRVAIDSVQLQQLTVRNPSLAPVDVTLALEGEDAAAFSSSEAGKPLTVGPGQERALTLAFRPAQLGLALGAARLSVCPSCPPVVAELSGTGISQQVTVTPLSVDFGRVALGAMAQEKVTLSNDGNEPLRIDRLRLTEPSYTLVQPPVTPLTLAPGERLELTLAFKPLVTGPAPRGLLELGVTAQNVAPTGYKLPVRGEGGSTCVQLNPRSLDFGLVPEGMSVTRSVDVINRCFQSIQLTDFGVSTSAGGFLSLGQAGAMRELAAGEISPVKITFTPKAGSAKTAGVLAFKATEGKTLHSQAVPVVGASRAMAPCRFSVTPAAVDFGQLPVGAEVTLGISVRNDGTDQCLVSGFQLAAGSDAVFSTTGATSALIDPGQKAVLLAKVRALVPGTYAGLAEAFVNHPTDGHLLIPLKAKAVDSCFALQPTQVDFGVMKLTCGVRKRSVNAVNNCTSPVAVSGAALTHATSGELSLSAPALPATVQPGGTLSFSVAYSPTDDGTDSAALEVRTAAAGTFVAGLLGKGVVKPDQTDRFLQESLGKVDVLFVIDNSGSMMEEQQSLGQNFAAFMSAAQAANIDYHIGVTTTGIEGSPGGWSVCPGGVEGGEAGRLAPVDGSAPRIITPATPNAAQVFASNVRVGWCHWNEQGLEGAFRALNTPLVNSADDPTTAMPMDGNLGFLRPDAKLAIIFVTDEDDFSPQPVAYYETFFKAVKNNDPTLLSISAIIGPENLATCPTASSAGIRYLQLAKATGGGTESICTANWASSLQNLSSNTFGPGRRFPLSQVPADATKVTVMVEGQPMTEGWTYEAATRSVVFAPGRAPANGALIEITYPLGC